MTAIKWHGGKHYLAKTIIEQFPPHTHYVEPFAGGLSVLLAKPAELIVNHSEVVNDIDWSLTNFWRVLRSPTQFPKLARALDATPFSQVEWRESCEDSIHIHDDPDGDWREALKFFVRCRQSMAGRMASFAPLSKRRTRRGMNEQASAWMNAIDGLPEIHDRLSRVVIFNDDFADVIKREDSDETLFYLDPPYVHDTRSSKSVYANEMSDEDHKRLLDRILYCAGKIVLSGYPNEMYDDTLHCWRTVDIEIDNKSASGKSKRKMTERLWMNY